MEVEENIDINQSVIDVLEGSVIRLVIQTKTEIKRVSLVDSFGNECQNIKINGKNIVCEIEPDQIRRVTWSLNLFDENEFDLYKKVFFDIVGKKDQHVNTSINISKLGNVLTPVANFGMRWDANDDFGIFKMSMQIKELDIDESVVQNIVEVIAEESARNVTSKNGVYEIDLEKYKLNSGNSVIVNLVGQDFKRDRESPSYSNIFRFQIISDQEYQKYLFDKEEELGFGVSLVVKTVESMLSEFILQLETQGTGTASDNGVVFLNMQKKVKELTLKNQLFIEKFEIIVNEIIVNKFEVYNEADLKRIREFVLKSFYFINQELFPLQLSSLASIGNKSDRQKLIESKKCCEMILSEYQRILKNIRRAEGYHETVTLLREVIKSQKDLLEKTKDRKNDKIEGFFNE